MPNTSNLSLKELLTLEKLDINLFRSQIHQENFRQNLFGGQVLGQALNAATLTLADSDENFDRLANSCHAYFLHPGSSSTPIIYDVDVLRRGNSFSNVRVLARQMGRTIFSMAVSFHRQEPGYEHQTDFDINTVPKPEQLETMPEYLSRTGQTSGMNREDPYIEFRPVNPQSYVGTTVSEPASLIWFRAKQSLSNDLAMQRAALAFASDLGLMFTCTMPHPLSVFSDKVMTASLDHAIWFHHNVNCENWLLYKTDSPWAGAGRGMNRGLIFDQTGQLVASTAQEGLVRLLS